MLRSLASLSICMALLGVTASEALAQEPGPSADPRIAARALGYAGVEAFQTGDYANAELKLQRAFALLPVPSLGLWSARALVKIGRFVEASQRYLEVGRLPLAAGDPEIQKQARLEAESERAALLPKIPSVRLELKAATWNEVSVSIDGVPVAANALARPIDVNPGQHRIEARRIDASGSTKTAAVVTLAPAQHQSVILKFGVGRPLVSPRSPAPRSPALLGLDSDGDDLPALEASEGEARHGTNAWRTGGWTSVGVGGGLLGASGIAGLVAWSQLDDFDCNQDPCRSQNRSLVEDYGALRTFSMIGYIAGGLLVGAGTLILLESADDETQLSMGIGPGSATLGARF